ncbi:sugar ABC transporter substrate-binding protein [Breznakiella homolactica]|uniref:Sugar ABC transporter substrate-binding protein n=1 Tax=Breznakiella homolactica TaxID=2798577 RepID=A0A7T7XMI0_9SPIR|nr:sugar ABC transporter substrate-binding protein [Breznakiella homolactica]QQO09090.1 sugar ABC transporter substrate-binding protein [Breznakiella homolactica]
MKRLVVLFLALVVLGGSIFAGGKTDTDSGKIVIGYSQRRLAGSDWWKTMVQGATESAAEEANVELIVLDANGDTVQQNADINTLINRGVSAIIVNPNDPLGLTAAINAANNAGIPVIAANCALDATLARKIYGYVVEDEVAGGATGGYLLAQKFSEKYPGVRRTKGVIIGGNPGDVNSENRAEGYMKGWTQWNNDNPSKSITINWLPLQYGNWLPNDAMPVIRDIATAHQDLQVVVSLSDVMHAGIVQALDAAGIWPNVIMAEYDGYQTTVKEMMDNPNGPIQAMTTNEPYSQGWDAVKMALRAINGGQPEGTVYVETSSFGPEDAAKYYDPSLICINSRKVKK